MFSLAKRVPNYKNVLWQWFKLINVFCKFKQVQEVKKKVNKNKGKTNKNIGKQNALILIQRKCHTPWISQNQPTLSLWWHFRLSAMFLIKTMIVFNWWIILHALCRILQEPFTWWDFWQASCALDTKNPVNALVILVLGVPYPRSVDNCMEIIKHNTTLSVSHCYKAGPNSSQTRARAEDPAKGVDYYSCTVQSL